MPVTDDPNVISISGQLAEMMRVNEAEEQRSAYTQRKEPTWGVTPDVPFWEYLLWDAFGSSTIRDMGHSPAHMRYKWTSGLDANPRLFVGSAIHACIFEPDTEWPRYQRLPDGLDRRSKDYKEMAEEYGPDFVLRDKEYDSAVGIRDNLLGHSRIGRLLKSGTPEIAFAWKDEETGIPLKGRADWLNEDLHVCFDLKSTGDARESAFRRVAKNHDYAVQGAHYIAGLQALGKDIKHYTIVAAEVDPPYEVMLYRIGTREMMVAHEYWRMLVDLLHWCIDNQRWPGYAEHTHVLSLGMWWEADTKERIELIREVIT